MAGVLLHKRYAFCIGTHRLRENYNRKYAAFMEIMILLLVFLLLTANRTGYDILNYERAYLYLHEAFEGKDKLFGVISVAAYQTGMTFWVFRAVLTFLSGMLAVDTLKKIGVDFTFVLLFYLPSMLFVDSMQFRNAVCLSLFLWSFRFLLFGGKYANAKFIVCILVIAQIHALYYFALSLSVFFFKKRREQIAVFLFLAGMALSVVTAVNGNQVPFFTEVANLFLAATDLRGVTYATSGNLGWTVPAAIHCLTALLCLAVCRYARSKKDCFTNRQMEYLDLLFVYDLILFVSVPAIMMNLHYYRMIRGAFMMNVIGASFLFQKKGKWKRMQYGVFAALALSAALWCVLDIGIFENCNTMAVPVLDGRLFFLK